MAGGGGVTRPGRLESGDWRGRGGGQGGGDRGRTSSTERLADALGCWPSSRPWTARPQSRVRRRRHRGGLAFRPGSVVRGGDGLGHQQHLSRTDRARRAGEADARLALRSRPRRHPRSAVPEAHQGLGGDPRRSTRARVWPSPPPCWSRRPTFRRRPERRDLRLRSRGPARGPVPGRRRAVARAPARGATGLPVLPSMTALAGSPSRSPQRSRAIWRAGRRRGRSAPDPGRAGPGGQGRLRVVGLTVARSARGRESASVEGNRRDAMTIARTYPPGVTSWSTSVGRPRRARRHHLYGGFFGWTFDQATPDDAPFRYLIARLHGQDAAGLGGPAAPERRSARSGPPKSR